MNIDYLSQLPVDVFIQNITYLPFDSVINIYEYIAQFADDKTIMYFIRIEI